MKRLVYRNAKYGRTINHIFERSTKFCDFFNVSTTKRKNVLDKVFLLVFSYTSFINIFFIIIKQIKFDINIF